MTPTHLALLAAVWLGCCGLGRLILGRTPARDDRHSAIAQAIVGLLAYSGMYSLVLLLDVGFDPARLVVAGLVLAGCVVWCVDLVRRSPCRRERIGVLGVGLLLLGLVSWLPGNPNSADPSSYAFLSSTALQPDWVGTQLNNTALYGVATTNRVYAASRGAAIALLWPASALGVGVGPGAVADVAQWLVLLALLLLIDLLSTAGTPLLARVLIAAAGIGAFTEEAILSGGQLGQAFGMLAAIAAIWLDRNLTLTWARWLSLALVGYVVAAGYPEFLAALPLYIACVVFFEPYTWRRLVATGVAVLLGMVIAELVTRGITISYLVYQSSSGPTAQPLTDDPRSALDVWRWVVLERPFTRWLLVLLAALALLFVFQARKLRGLEWQPIGAVSMAGIVLLMAVLTWAVPRSGNPNYATFKLSSWVGPVLLIGLWALVGASRGRITPALGVAVLVLASYRAIGLVWWAGSTTLDNVHAAGPSAEWQVVSNGPFGACTLEIVAPAPNASIVERAIAESAAPARGCSVRLPNL